MSPSANTAGASSQTIRIPRRPEKEPAGGVRPWLPEKEIAPGHPLPCGPAAAAEIIATLERIHGYLEDTTPMRIVHRETGETITDRTRIDPAAELATFYAAFQIFAAVVVTIGYGDLIAYKISASLVLKPEANWSPEDRAAVEGYTGLRQLEKRAATTTLDAEEARQLAILRERDARGGLRSYITALDPLVFYIVYTLVVGGYILMGGMAATALNEAFQSLLIVAFSPACPPARAIRQEIAKMQLKLVAISILERKIIVLQPEDVSSVVNSDQERAALGIGKGSDGFHDDMGTSA